MKQKVVVGLSGGVDSAVSAYLLKEAGYEVQAVFMQNWDSALNGDLADPYIDEEICQAQIDYQDAQEVAQKLEIPITKIDFVKEYWEKVFEYFLSEYRQMRTPNPDILCNKHIKFDAFLNYALENFDADYIAMGHYAQVEHAPDGSVKLLRGVDQNKDQTYFLSQLSQEQLTRTLFPIGKLEKAKVREIAKREGLIVYDKKDSTGICFIGERNFTSFLTNYIDQQPGEIIDIETRQVIGEHKGLTFYTIGQRKGLNIGGIKNFPNAKWYVVGKDIQNNQLVVSHDFEDYYLKSDEVILTEVNFLGKDLKEITSAKFRYRAADIKILHAEKLEDGRLLLKHEVTKAVAPGQACVFYNGEECLGGGEIDQVYYEDKLKDV